MFRKLLAFLAAMTVTFAFAAVDVNKASPAELDGIKGIGPGISGKIVDERKKGNFKSWEDFIERVKGVGEGNAAKFSADGLTVGGAGYKGAPAAPAKPDAKPAAAAASPGKNDAKPASAATATVKADVKPAAPAAAVVAAPAMAKEEKKDPKAEAKAKKVADAKIKADEKAAKKDVDAKTKADAKAAKDKPAAKMDTKADTKVDVKTAAKPDAKSDAAKPAASAAKN